MDPDFLNEILDQVRDLYDFDSSNFMEVIERVAYRNRVPVDYLLQAYNNRFNNDSYIQENDYDDSYDY